MTIWRPDLDRLPGPAYLALAEALARDVGNGRLSPGERLPTHRDLARDLGVTVGTVSRGYAEARRRGLVSGEVGRGTFVRREHVGPSLHGRGEGDLEDLIDLSFNLPPLAATENLLRRALLQVMEEGEVSRMLQYQPHGGAERHRRAGAAWIGSSGWSPDPAEVLVTSGAQHALLLALSVLTEPGDLVATEAVTYQGLKALGRFLNFRLEGLPLDGEGLRADAFAELCRRSPPKALYCMPTLQNPTGRIMGEKRRREIAEVAETHGVAVVEDDLYGFLAPAAPPPIAALLPERGYYATSLSKSLAPGLRIGYLRGPTPSIKALVAAMMTTSHMASPLTGEMASMLIEKGTAVMLAQRQQEEIRLRQGRARSLIGDHVAPGCSELAAHLWLALPEPWRAEEFASEARHRGVAVASSEVFAVGRGASPHAVRLSLGAPSSLRELERGLEVLRGLLGGPPPPALAGV